jgi:peptide/nickel transport system permease protein
MGSMTTWLLDPNPTSRRQARMGQTYLSWLRLRRNPLAVIGLAIAALLVLTAILRR